jgi:hypothetical protein
MSVRGAEKVYVYLESLQWTRVSPYPRGNSLRYRSEFLPRVKVIDKGCGGGIRHRHHRLVTTFETET